MHAEKEGGCSKKKKPVPACVKRPFNIGFPSPMNRRGDVMTGTGNYEISGDGLRLATSR